MTTAAVAVVLVVIAAVLVVAVMKTIGSTPSDHAEVENSQWLAAASLAVERGRRVASRLRDEPGTVQADADVTHELSGLTALMVELSASAPTAMDKRVCRNLGVRSQALHDELRSQHHHEKPTLRGRPSATTTFRDRQADFELAVRDLAEHVNLV